MATCTAAGLIHERNRWRTMDDIRLGTRLRQITKPNKLACFLNVCSDRGNNRLLGRGIARCNILGFSAMETRPGWWSVVVNPTGPFTGPAGERFREAADDIRPEWEDRDGGMLVPDDVAEEILNTYDRSDKPKPKVGIIVHPEEEPEPKKKKSLYSRKLRTKRR